MSNNDKTGVFNLKNKKRAFSIAEVAELTTLSKRYIELKIQDGTLPATRFGRRLIILSEDLDAFLHRGVPRS